MAWTALPASTGTAYQNTLVLDNADQARNERKYARNHLSFGKIGAFHTSGNNLQQASDIAATQLSLEQEGVSYIIPTIDFAGDAAPGNTDTWQWGTMAALWTDAGISSSGWYAEYPREIGTLSDPGTDGWKAINVVDGYVYERITGVWTLLGGLGLNKPDTLTATRRADIGDYLNKATFNEIYEVAKRMHILSADYLSVHQSWNIFATLVASSPSIAYENKTGHGATPGQDIGFLWITAQTAADVDYAADSVSSGSGGGTHGGSHTVGRNDRIFGPPDFDGYRADVYANRYAATVVAGVMDIAFATTFVARAKRPWWNGTDGNITDPEWDTQGADLVEDVWHNYDIQGAAVGDKTSIYIGVDPTTYEPMWVSAPSAIFPDGIFTNTLGWQLFGLAPAGSGLDPDTDYLYYGIAGICDFNVTDGFAMQ